ncbi:hypothetical protein DL769_007618 [Monosporascus sp. CRB-8-3]|nr:hypothetical protein DL769_007618 [Monosporascus sp. CRB-8-3]
MVRGVLRVPPRELLSRPKKITERMRFKRTCARGSSTVTKPFPTFGSKVHTSMTPSLPPITFTPPATTTTTVQEASAVTTTGTEVVTPTETVYLCAGPMDYQGPTSCVVSRATNAAAGTDHHVTGPCPAGTFEGLIYGPDVRPAFQLTGNIGPAISHILTSKGMGVGRSSPFSDEKRVVLKMLG